MNNPAFWTGIAGVITAIGSLIYALRANANSNAAHDRIDAIEPIPGKDPHQ